MPLTSSSVKRSVDPTGDDIKTFTDSGSKVVQAVAVLDGFATNHLEEATAVLTYIGKQRMDGAWLLVKMDTTTGIVLTYASIVNNATVTTYAAAWAGRATLTYGLYSEVF